MYKKMYKCRLCGEVITTDIVGDEITIYSEIQRLLEIECEQLYTIHNCSLGTLGIAELQGIKEEINY